MREYRKYKNEEIVKICKEFFNDIIIIDKNVDNVSRCEYFNAFYDRCKVIPWNTEVLTFSTNVEKLIRTKCGGCQQLIVDKNFSKFIEQANKKFHIICFKETPSFRVERN